MKVYLYECIQCFQIDEKKHFWRNIHVALIAINKYMFHVWRMYQWIDENNAFNSSGNVCSKVLLFYFNFSLFWIFYPRQTTTQYHIAKHSSKHIYYIFIHWTEWCVLMQAWRCRLWFFSAIIFKCSTYITSILWLKNIYPVWISGISL